MKVELHRKQSRAFSSPATELLYGGAAGGGKSFLLRVSAIRWCLAVPGLQVFLFRRTYPDLRANHLNGPGNLHTLLAEHTAAGDVSWRAQETAFRFANGSRLRLCHLMRDSDLAKYQGAEIHVLLIDELTHFTEAQYRFLRSRVRCAGLDVPKVLASRLPRIECATNPGSVGHQWVKQFWVDPAAPCDTWQTEDEDGGMLRQYLPARLEDSPALTNADPDYAKRLSGLGAPEWVKSMREGDWNIAQGQALEMWDEKRHVIEPFAIPPHWTRFRAFDWGSSKPFSVGWWAVSDGSYPRFPCGALIRYREWYGWDGRADHGLRLTSTEVAHGIRTRETADERIAFSAADPSCFGRHDGPSVAERMAAHGILLKRAANDRKSGFQEVRHRLKGEDGRPMLFVFSTCRDGFIRTVPALVLDADNPEDVDTTLEDHAYDETRYACMSRPFTAARVPSEPHRDRWAGAFHPKEHSTWKTN
ncbi:MAG: terminase large subunit domain-containing protein [Leptospirillia bacterium]